MDSYQSSRTESRSKSKSKSKIEAAWKDFYSKAAGASIEAAESRLLNNEGWQSPTWEFTRRCKAQVAFKDKTADEMIDLIPWDLLPFDEEDQLQFMCELPINFKPCTRCT